MSVPAPLHRFLDRLAERQDVILAVFVVSVIFMLIIPLPTVLVDILIAANISISVILLMVAVYLATPLDFAAFPAVLLITTLFRLALSISTTRLILLQADAGRIVDTFGNFVVGGNLVVGLVIFLILTIVQFVVITKGAERVAEVSARFSLDALPGKQLSIDADMRSGSITLEEAKDLRGRIQRESRLYGSMDGAMKFVKGDAIATLIIVFVNLLGGLAIGTLQRGLSFGEAISTYSVLTIGDGLIAQIPALFISITAGIIVTRVTDESQDASNLGRDIGSQIGKEPRALLIAAAMLVVFAFVPGFPAVVFVFMALALGGPAVVATVARRRGAAAAAEAPLAPSEAAAPVESVSGGFSAARDEIFAPTVALMVELGPQAASLGGAHELRDAVNQTRLSIYYRLGVSLPVIETRVNSALTGMRYRVFVGEIPTGEGELREGSLFVADREENLSLFDIPFEEGVSLVAGVRSLWVSRAREADLSAAGVKFLRPLEVLVWHAETIFSRYAAGFLGIQETRRILQRMEAEHGELVKEVQRVLPIQTVAELLRRLVQENVSIRDLRQIFGAVVEWGSREKDPILLVEHIRAALARQISYQYAATNNILTAFLLDNELEETVRGAVRQTSSGSYLALKPEISRRIVESVRRQTEHARGGETPSVLVTEMDIRRYLRRLIEVEIPELPVLSFQEVAPEITLQPLDRITA
ncbi:MAG: type III secretion system export apparatus subunit SctV [Alphaproteobacteria bacterium]|nr:type III secretion system export apparatus subunit SctV [Alphaproteobacteria bacterium]MDA8003521.1 type III secretion system export apparatus subunit SctV [Alphaproteobacteria bacterium]MDA8005545.1 type III secretion system export apparatus subunit SctV [Alphaproteobacteria bacterium]MDA8012710.1 type III secretion system export apparatus subunit SctV [Alphaproteobacteria bacterium]